MEKIIIFDTTLRDGEQAPGYSMTSQEKLRMALQLEALGVDIMEAGFAIASRDDAEGIAQIAKAVKNSSVCSLARARTQDIDAAAKAVAKGVHPRIHTFIATSDLHLREKLHISREECLRQVGEMVAYARGKCAEVEFSAEDASRTDLDFLCRVIEEAIKAGARTVNIPDTVGYSMPHEFGNIIRNLCNRVPNIDQAVISTHCHDDLGFAVANSLEGIMAGARQVECTIGGIGERAGNAALEELVMALSTRKDYFPSFATNIKTTEITRTATLLANITGIKIAPNKAVIGANAFAHESGIHQHGVLANAKTYEIMTPEAIGLKKTELVLGKHSGRHAFVEKLQELGYVLADNKIDNLFADFKALADRKKTIGERDLVALVEAAVSSSSDPEKEWRLDSFVVNSGNHMKATAQVTLTRGGKKKAEAALGTGPVYASFAAIEKIIRQKITLEDYQIRAVTEHRDALGEVLVKVSGKSGTRRGRGVSTDIIEGSILAFLNAINKLDMQS